MNSLTIQILLLLATFLFYRVLRSGFDSWTAVLIDFGAVLFLFGLQYFLQRNSNNNAKSFPSGDLSRLTGVMFPDKINFDIQDQNTSTQTQTQTQTQTHTQTQRLKIFMKPDEDLYMEANQKITLPLSNADHEVQINKSGLYMIQFSVVSDQTGLQAKFTIAGSKTQFDKTIHQGENCFIVHLDQDKIHFEIENGIKPTMILKESIVYLIEL